MKKCSENAPMKLATYKDGSRDGQLVVVSRDLRVAQFASHIATRLQQVLDDWNYFSPQLQDVYDALNAGRARAAFAFDATRCMAPLPRAYQWAHANAYPHHLELLYQARGADVPENLHVQVRMYQGGSDGLLGPHDPIACAEEAFGVDFEAALAVITSDIPVGCTADRALEGVRLLMLVNDVHLRHLAPDEALDAGVDVQSKPATAFSPVAITPDELGEAWSKGRVHLPLQCSWNGRRVGMCEAGPEMRFHFGQLIAHLAKTRSVGAGSIIGSGAVSNKGTGKKGALAWPAGYSTIAQKRAMEILQDGHATTGFMKPGDTIRIEMKDASGQTVFGAIEQEFVPLNNLARPHV